jgi:hypothetical protein
MFRETGVKLDKENWYEHAPKSIETSQEVRTDRTIPNNKSEIMICDNEKATYVLIDVAI